MSHISLHGGYAVRRDRAARCSAVGSFGEFGGFEFGSCRSESSDVAEGFDELLRGIGKLRQHTDKERGRPGGPFAEGDAPPDARLRLDAGLHVQLGLRPPNAPGRDECKLCARFKWALAESVRAERVRLAAARLLDFDVDCRWFDPQWLDRPVLVAAGDFREPREDMVAARSLTYEVGLVPTHLCEVCTPNAGELLGKAPVVFERSSKMGK